MIVHWSDFHVSLFNSIVVWLELFFNVENQQWILLETGRIVFVERMKHYCLLKIIVVVDYFNVYVFSDYFCSIKYITF